MRDPRVLAYFQILELEIHEGVQLFELLDNGDGVVSSEDFVAGVNRLKGQARAVDVISMMRDSQRLMQMIRDLQDGVSQLFGILARGGLDTSSVPDIVNQQSSMMIQSRSSSRRLGRKRKLRVNELLHAAAMGTLERR